MYTLSSLTISSLFALSVLNPVLAATNGERMARGLSLLKPKRLFDGSKTLTARSGTPSNTPPGTTVTGACSVYAPSSGNAVPTRRAPGTFLGYIGAGALSSTYSWSNEITYTMPSTSSDLIKVYYYRYSSPWQLTAGVMGTGLGTPDGQGGFTRFNYDLAPGSSNYISLVPIYGDLSRLSDSPSGPAIYSTSTSTWTENVVWRIAPETGIVTLVWSNIDGSQPPLTLCTATNYKYNPSGAARIVATVDEAATTAKLLSQSEPEVLGNCGLTIVFDATTAAATAPA